MKVYIGIDIGKKKCDYCIVNTKGRILERGLYLNRTADAEKLAEKMAHKY